ncbi:MAG: hypothetical protein J5507_04340 [Clostridia bacterium]|nr:hypothetical protein [Clostridia bacterium]
MKIVIFILSIIIGIKTVSYGVYELKENKNTFGGIFIIALAAISTILPNVVVFFRGI